MARLGEAQRRKSEICKYKTNQHSYTSCAEGRWLALRRRAGKGACWARRLRRIATQAKSKPVTITVRSKPAKIQSCTCKLCSKWRPVVNAFTIGRSKNAAAATQNCSIQARPTGRTIGYNKASNHTIKKLFASQLPRPAKSSGNRRLAKK